MNYLETYFNGVLKNSLAIKANIISIGRAPDNDLIIDNRGVSNHHAVISLQDNVFYLEDLNSTNGTFLNSEKITTKVRINPQDAIIIGKHTVKFSEWGQAQDNTSKIPTNIQDNDATVFIKRNTEPGPTLKAETAPQHTYLMVSGDLKGINKIFMTEDSYGIGKGKQNAIRLGGWFTPQKVADINKIGHSFFLNPHKKNWVQLNGKIINDNVRLTPSDEIKIKKLSLKFITD